MYTTRRLSKPVYKRQQFLLAFAKELKEPCSSIDFQKLLFLYSVQNNLPFYEFVPYLYGCYSMQAAEDVRTLQAMGWLDSNTDRIHFVGSDPENNAFLPFCEAGVQEQLPKLRGNRLIKLVYEQYPYYAINSKKAADIMDTAGLTRINVEKEQLKQNEQMLFTIGYEGITVEKYLNTLIQNDVHVLCDVRNNPLSRKFGFSKSSLQKYLANIGIEYIHIPELGIVSEKRKSLNSDQDYKSLFKDYAASLRNRQQWLGQIYNLLQTKQRVALTCFEHEPSHCHRHVIRVHIQKNYNVKTADL
jgi:hypothetical protein